MDEHGVGAEGAIADGGAGVAEKAEEVLCAARVALEGEVDCGVGARSRLPGAGEFDCDLEALFAGTEEVAGLCAEAEVPFGAGAVVRRAFGGVELDGVGDAFCEGFVGCVLLEDVVDHSH